HPSATRQPTGCASCPPSAIGQRPVTMRHRHATSPGGEGLRPGTADRDRREDHDLSLESLAASLSRLVFAKFLTMLPEASIVLGTAMRWRLYLRTQIYSCKINLLYAALCHLVAAQQPAARISWRLVVRLAHPST